MKGVRNGRSVTLICFVTVKEICSIYNFSRAHDASESVQTENTTILCALAAVQDKSQTHEEKQDIFKMYYYSQTWLIRTP